MLFRSVDEDHSFIAAQIAPLHESPLHLGIAHGELHPDDPVADSDREEIRDRLRRASSGRGGGGLITATGADRDQQDQAAKNEARNQICVFHFAVG